MPDSIDDLARVAFDHRNDRRVVPNRGISWDNEAVRLTFDGEQWTACLLYDATLDCCHLIPSFEAEGVTAEDALRKLVEEVPEPPASSPPTARQRPS